MVEKTGGYPCYACVIHPGDRVIAVVFMPEFASMCDRYFWSNAANSLTLCAASVHAKTADVVQ